MSLLFPPAPIRLVPFVLASALIAWLTLAPSSDLPTVNIWDKFEHAGAYFGLAILGAWAFPRRLLILALALGLCGVVIEGLQSIMALGRTGDLTDALANGAGIVAGIMIALIVRARFGRRPSLAFQAGGVR